jgi:hypothetical protein
MKRHRLARDTGACDGKPLRTQSLDQCGEAIERVTYGRQRLLMNMCNRAAFKTRYTTLSTLKP